MKVPSRLAKVDLDHDTSVVKGDTGRAPGDDPPHFGVVQ
jgi:hypothetical protein